MGSISKTYPASDRFGYVRCAKPGNGKYQQNNKEVFFRNLPSFRQGLKHALSSISEQNLGTLIKIQVANRCNINDIHTPALG